MLKKNSLITLLTLSCVFPLLGKASFSSKGEVRLESRYFIHDDKKETEDFNLGLFARVEGYLKARPFYLKIRGVGRVDAFDKERNIAFLEEAWMGLRWSMVEVKAGAQMINWTATEAFHPADVMNSRNLDSDIENAEKIGEPMVSLKIRTFEGLGAFEFFWMPFVMDPNFTGASSRLSFLDPGQKIGSIRWIDYKQDVLDNPFAPYQIAGRYKQTIGDADIGVHAIHHIDRSQPMFTFALNPVFQQVLQVGGTLQYILGPVAMKLEASHRMFEDLPEEVNVIFKNVDHTTLAWGVDYGWTHKNGMESTVISEGQHVLGTSQGARASLSIFQMDLLLGYRFVFNDVQGKEILFTTIFDVERREEFLMNLSYSQRLSETWSLKAGVRYTYAPQKKATEKEGLERLHDANQIFLNLSRHF